MNLSQVLSVDVAKRASAALHILHLVAVSQAITFTQVISVVPAQVVIYQPRDVETEPSSVLVQGSDIGNPFAK